MAAALIKREVAASFILKFPDGDERKTPWVALFKRSDRVRTYQYVNSPAFFSLLGVLSSSCLSSSYHTLLYPHSVKRVIPSAGMYMRC